MRWLPIRRRRRPEGDRGRVHDAFGVRPWAPREWVLVLLMAATGAGAGIIWTSETPVDYQTRVTFVVGIPEDRDDIETLVETARALSTSGVVVDEVARDVGRGLTAPAVRDRLSVERVSGSTVFQVVVTDRSAAVVRALSDSLGPVISNRIKAVAAEAPPKTSRVLTTTWEGSEVEPAPRLAERDAVAGATVGLLLGAAVVAVQRRRRGPDGAEDLYSPSP